MDKWYKVLTPNVVGGEISHYQICYKEGLIDWYKDTVILKEYDSKEEMINDLSK